MYPSDPPHAMSPLEPGDDLRMLQSIDLRIRTAHMRLDVDWFRAIQQNGLPNQEWHSHKHPEIHFLLEGEVGYAFADGEILLEAGQALVIPAQAAHCLRASGRYYRYVMMASLETFDEDPEAMLFRAFFSLNAPAVVPLSGEMEACLKSSMQEAAARRPGFRTLIEGHVTRLLILLIRSALPLGGAPAYPVREKKALNLERMQSIQRLLEQEPDLSLERLAERLYLSPRQVQRIIREQGEASFQQLVAAVRVHRAKELLHSHDLTISEIAERVGFQSSQSFIRFFRQQEKQTPAQYRASSLSGGRM